MKAIVLEKAGGIENLEVEELPVPKPAKGEVLIKIAASGVNPVDMKTRTGKALYAQLQKDAPVILGWDVAGEVTQLGDGVTSLKIEDPVFGMINFPGHGKAYAEYAVALVEHLAVKPDNLTNAEAAAGTLAALTAWQVLTHEAKVTKGQKVLIHAAAGGVGHFAVQIAKYLGAYVVGTASASNAAFLEELGVDEHIDYKKEKFEDVVKEVDMVLDTVGGDTTIRSVSTLKKGGKLFTIANSVSDELEKAAKVQGVTVARYLVHSSGKDMKALASLMEERIITPHVSQEFKLEDVQEAHKQIESGKTRGKIVLIP